MFSVMWAGVKSAVNQNVTDGATRQSELIKPGADGRVTVTPDMITGVQAVKERMNAPFKSKEIIDKFEAERAQANAVFNQNEMKLRENAQLQKRQRTQAAMEKARVESAPRRAPASGPSYYHNSQWNQPYQANGSDWTLSHIDLMTSVNSVAFQKFGDRVFTYDDNGKVLSSEYTLRNVNGIAKQISSWSVSIPEDAIIKIVSTDNDTLSYSATYYIDPQTGERHDISLYKSVYYNGELVTMIRKDLDETGKLVDNAKVESEFDAQGRPVVTTRYTVVYITDTSTGKRRTELKPSRKTEYEYLPNGLVTTIESYLQYDYSTNQDIWTYQNRRTEGTDNEGVYCYEYVYYSTYYNDWTGSSKYNRVEKETADGGREVMQTNWSWNNTTKDWQISNKQFTRYNSRDNRTLSETYNWSEPLQTFYLTSVYGYEFIGDTASCADWYVRYNRPDSIQQLDNMMSLISYGNRNEYADYTLKELGWTVYPDYMSLPRKYDTRYSLDMKNKESVSWIPSGKTEYDYVLLAMTDYDDHYDVLTSGQREYVWNDSVWVLGNEYKYAYNDHGDKIMDERYRDGQAISRQTYDYVYYYRVNSYGDSILERKVISEKYWSYNSYSEKLVPSSEYTYDYDKDYSNQIVYSYNYGWSETTNSWNYGYKTEYEYDDNNRQTLSVNYSWSKDKGIWIGTSKEASVFNAAGETLKRENWNNSSDTSTVWTPSYIEVVEYDDYGRLTSNWYCSYWTGGSWDSGTRYDYSYSADGLLLSESQYYMSSGQWSGSYKVDYEYNDKGNITLSQTFENYATGTDEWVPRMKNVYSYTDTNELLDLYEYSFNGIEWKMEHKKLAVIEDGVITAYVDSVYDYGYDKWLPITMITITRDETTGIVTSLYQNWDSSEEIWYNDRRESSKYDAEGRITYTESYYWSTWYDYNTSAYKDGWTGDNRAEYAYNDMDEQIMTATYYWDSYDSVWVGRYKGESEYDESGRQTLYGSYYWDYDNNEWYGTNRHITSYDANGNLVLSISFYWDYELKDWVAESKSEYEYDEDGNEIMNTYYDGTDSEGNWIGSSRYGYYYKDNVSYNERYEWDAERKDWYGTYKSESTSSKTYYMSAEYKWDYTGWCWVGDMKREETYNDNGQESIIYGWDLEQATWVAERKELDEMTETASSNKYVHTEAEWNNSASGWVFTNRETNEEVYKADDNLDYELMLIEVFNPLTSAWVQSFSIKQVFVYKSLTGVEGIPVELTIRVQDGLIVVNAEGDSDISIAAVSGAQIASGKGSVEAPVAPGIYLISVDGKTTKVLVR